MPFGAKQLVKQIHSMKSIKMKHKGPPKYVKYLKQTLSYREIVEGIQHVRREIKKKVHGVAIDTQGQELEMKAPQLVEEPKAEQGTSGSRLRKRKE